MKKDLDLVKQFVYNLLYLYTEKQIQEGYTITETPTKGREEQLFEQVLNRLESLTMAGAVIIDIEQINQNNF